MSPRKINPNKIISPKIDRDKFLKPKKNNPYIIKKPKMEYSLLIEQISDLILSGAVDFQKQPRIQTPFTIGPGVTLKEGKGQILIENPLDNNISDLYVCAGRMSSYKAIAKSMSGHYTRFHLLKIKKYLTLPAKEKIIDLDSFNKYITKNRSNPLEKLKGNKEEKEKTRKALNYLSAILMFAEPFRFQDKGERSLDLINEMIKEYTPNNTPTKKVLGNFNNKGHNVVKKDALKIERKRRKRRFENATPAIPQNDNENQN